MQLWIQPALLILQCCIHLAVGNSQIQDANSLAIVRTVSFSGSTLNVFEIDGVLVAEPIVGVANSSCGSIRYNHLYLKYQLSIPLDIEANPLLAVSESPHGIGRITLTELTATADKALSSKDSQVTAVAQLKRSGGGLLIFLCDTFIRCQSLRDDVASNPEELWRAVKLVAVGRVGASSVSFGAVSNANSPPRLNCNSAGRWVVLQRRVDGSLSFIQNWDAYVKGFGNPESNYWMGLDRLFAMTVTGAKTGHPDTARCRLRVETTDLQGKDYWGEYKLFQVLGPEQNYRLRVGGEVAGSPLVNFLSNHNELQFSTYDRDHDAHNLGSCSQENGFGGWWYNACQSSNLNGAYTTDKSITSSSAYCNISRGGRYIPMKSTLMKFMCS